MHGPDQRPVETPGRMHDPAKSPGCWHFRRDLHRLGRPLVAIAAAALFSFLAAQTANAQAIEPGETVLTRFGGFDAATGFALDLDGPVALAIDTRHPGEPANGQALRNLELRILATAAEVGQIFGIAIDDSVPANVYVAASSAYGAYQLADGSWHPGQWGDGGGSGTIYRLDATNDYKPVPFADVRLGGRPNTGAALGNLAYDKANRQLFVSDLESGMIHRISLGGTDRGIYDHGSTGRAGFVDAATGSRMSLPAVAFDPASDARRSDCPTEYSRSPECWNLADFRRRVWGLSVRQDPATGLSRLYYSVWSSQGFGDPQWTADPADQSNTVWSIGLSGSGDFDTADIRRELTVPGFFSDLDDYNRAGPSNPITDIAISAAGEMLLAERGNVRKLEDGPRDGLIWPHESRVLRYVRDENGIWQADGRYDIGNADRADIGQPHLRAAAVGGVSYGPGYSASGEQDPNQIDAFAWATGDELCQVDAPCASSTAGQEDEAPLSGLQGQPGESPAEVTPAAAYTDYPEPGPATPGEGPARSYFIEAMDYAGSGWTGDMEIHTGGGSAPADGPPDLSVSKSMSDICLAGAICTGRVTVTNVGGGEWSGPLFLHDVTIPPGVDFAAVAPPWTCKEFGGERICYHAPVNLAQGQHRTLTVDIAVPAGFSAGNLVNCAEVAWPLENMADQRTIVRAAQIALTVLGYDPGPADGLFGPRTAAAVMALQSDVGLEPDGFLNQDVLDILYPDLSATPGDANRANDQACAESEIISTPPAGGVHLPVGSTPGHLTPLSVHQPIGSGPGHAFPVSVHQPIGSGPLHVFPHSVHQPWGSGPGHAFPASVHLPAGSLPGHVFPTSVHLPAGSLPGHAFPISVHLPIGSLGGHAFPLSVHLPVGSAPGHALPLSVHLPIGSGGPHGLPGSLHLPIGSGPGHLFPVSIHLPLGSNPGHGFPNSIHFPFGSAPGHLFPQSVHLPAGSIPGHLFPLSIHQPIGSFGGHIVPLSIHLPFGSNQGHLFPLSAHLPIGSNPGHLFPGSLHLPLGSGPGHLHPQSIHLPIGSAPDHALIQSIHQPIGSGPGHEPPQSIHMPFGSNLHGQIGSLHFPPGSGAHLPVGSIHAPLLSSPQLHEVVQSLSHTPIGSIHLPVGSGGHFPPGSLHFPVGSGHQPPGSNIHTLGESLHIPAGSSLTQPPGPSPAPPPPGGGGIQPHLPVGSTGPHRPVGSVHLPAGSVQPHRPIGSTQPHRPIGSTGLHLPIGSQAPHRPIGSVHQPRGSVQPHRPIGSIHQPIGSVQPHRPIGSIHQPIGSVQPHRPIGSVHRPEGSVQPHRPIGSIHQPIGSIQPHRPIGSKQPHRPAGSIHTPLGSRPQVHLPLGSRPQIHTPIGSNPQIHTPIGSNPQVHTPIGSRPQIHTPPGSTQELHLQRRSRAQSSGTQQPAHQPEGSTDTVHDPRKTREERLKQLQQKLIPLNQGTRVN